MSQCTDTNDFRAHPGLLRSTNKDVRYAAVRALAVSGDSRDIGALRSAANDSDEIVRLWAIRGLIRLNPPDLDAIVRLHLDIREARIALADHGDTVQLSWCLKSLNALASRRGDEAPMSDYDMAQTARAFARRHPEGVRAVFEKIAKLPLTTYRDVNFGPAVGYGGLAAMGDASALAHIRTIATYNRKDMFTRAEAIAWLGICRDQASIPLLHSLLNDKDVAENARAALSLMSLPKDQSSLQANVLPR